jgi:hypothetical protein
MLTKTFPQTSACKIATCLHLLSTNKSPNVTEMFDMKDHQNTLSMFGFYKQSHHCIPFLPNICIASHRHMTPVQVSMHPFDKQTEYSGLRVSTDDDI